jgi:hypothetical protein
MRQQSHRYMTLAVALLAGVGAALPQAAPAGNATNKAPSLY